MKLHKLVKTTVSLSLCLSLVIAFGQLPSVHADTLSDLRSKYESLQKEQQEIQSKLNDLNGQVSAEQQKKDTISSNIKAINSQISVLGQEIESLEKDIDSTNKNIQSTEENIKTTEQQYKERVCALYEAGETSKLELLLSSTSFTDFFNKFETIQVITDHDTKLKDDLTKQKESLESSKKELDEKKASLEDSKGTLAAKKEVVKVQLAEQEQILNGVQSSADEVENERDEIKENARQTDAEINAEIKRLAEIREKELQKNKVTVSSSYIVNYARGFLGTRYRSGSADPNYGFDCSGFVQYVFANAAGISLVHSSSGMASYGTAVSKDNLQAGDLVFFGYGSHIFHVGIYTGNGNFIAANTGSQWCVAEGSLFGDSYWGSHYVCARRIIN